MNTREWGGGDFLPLSTIGMISLPSSVFLIVTSLIVAWSTNVRKVFHYAVRLYRRLQEYLYVFLLHPLLRVLRELVGYVSWRKDPAKEGDVDGSRSSGGTGGLRPEASDFWERHRLERDWEYRIPEVNRRDMRKVWSVRAKKENKSK
ncbi:hypothetical protein NQ176_g5630 [Zarea fungicola]|uniref:Uncharacterized protein n=1 Tax=Zarea fungicola TaxID=93591 RepID=A0ACC1N9D2_9HYPO|nr:hypothetical protein NQ176_g5630 [Lecanicillium fungicola]